MLCDSDLTCVTIARPIEYVYRSRCGLGASSDEGKSTKCSDQYPIVEDVLP